MYFVVDLKRSIFFAPSYSRKCGLFICDSFHIIFRGTFINRLAILYSIHWRLNFGKKEKNEKESQYFRIARNNYDISFLQMHCSEPKMEWKLVWKKWNFVTHNLAVLLAFTYMKSSRTGNWVSKPTEHVCDINLPLIYK